MSTDVLTPGPLLALDYVGIAVFAVSGALVAAERRQNPVTFAFFAVATGVGGGTLRDLMIGAPVFWVGHNTTLLVCLGAAALVWFLTRAKTAPRALVWFDAIGLAAYAVYGTAKALRYGVAPVPAGFMGVLTACAGGILRDVLADHPSILLRPEIYVTSAAVAAVAYVGLWSLGTGPVLAAVIAACLGFGLRALAILKGVELPSFPGTA